jgi:hypothetical protein
MRPGRRTALPGSFAGSKWRLKRAATAKNVNFRKCNPGKRQAGGAAGRGRITNIQIMFDRIMENSMAMWMLVSALFPIFFFGTLIKAALHFRRMRALKEQGEILPRPVLGEERVEANDWVPSR